MKLLLAMWFEVRMGEWNKRLEEPSSMGSFVFESSMPTYQYYDTLSKVIVAHAPY